MTRQAQVTLDRLGRHCLQQPRQGYRFSIDSVLLAHFASLGPGPVVDLGAGCGVLCLLLAGRGQQGPFCAVELDPLAAACCRANLEGAGLPGRVLEHDLNLPHPDLAPGSFSLAMSNPPFGRKGAGRLPPQPARAQARHELNLAAGRLWGLAQDLLAPGGRLALCWPPARLVEALTGLVARGLTPKRLRLVHGRQEAPASLALIEAVKGGRAQLKVLPPLIVYGQGQKYTPEVAAIYQAME